MWAGVLKLLFELKLREVIAVHLEMEAAELSSGEAGIADAREHANG